MKIHSNFQNCCTSCIAELLNFLFFVTAVDVVILSQYFHDSMSNLSHLPGVYQRIERWIHWKKKSDLFSLTGCKNLPTATDHALFSIWLRYLIPLILFSGDSSHDNRRWVKIPTFTSVLTWKCETDHGMAP